jgi:uncharacterized RDD family membrane protein YckC
LAEAGPPPAGLRVRLAAMVYEALLMFGVLFMATYLYAALTQQRHALEGRAGLQAFVAVVAGIYFAWFWSQGRQTVAQKTWRIQLMARDGGPVSQARALARYVAAWLWFAPGLLVLAVTGWRSAGAITLTLSVGWLVYALIALMDADRQFLHDRLCRTRLVRRP